MWEISLISKNKIDGILIQTLSEMNFMIEFQNH